MATQEKLWHTFRCKYEQLEDKLNELSGSPSFSVIDIMASGGDQYTLLYIDTQVASSGNFLTPVEPEGEEGIEDATGEEPLSKLRDMDKV